MKTKREGCRVVSREEWLKKPVSLLGRETHTGCFLYPTPNAGTSKASQAFWQVDDVKGEVAELKARGVVF